MADAKDFDKLIGGTQALMLLVPRDQYQSKMITVMKYLDSMKDKICYVAFTKPYDTYVSQFGKEGIDVNKFFFIDTVTSTVSKPKDVKNCVFVSSPSALTEISLAFNDLIKKCSSSFVEPVATLLSYQAVDVIVRFVHGLVTKTRAVNKQIILILSKDENEDLKKELYIFVDEVVDISNLKGKVAVKAAPKAKPKAAKKAK